jgi:hypothetical protein
MPAGDPGRSASKQGTSSAKICDRGGMNIDGFWHIVEAAARDGRENADSDFEDGYVEALRSRLAELPAQEIVDFRAWWIRLAEQADVPGVRAAAWIIDDERGFDSFVAGAIALGRATFEKAVADPDSLADSPVVREIAAQEAHVQEIFLYFPDAVPESVYKQQTGRGLWAFNNRVDERLPSVLLDDDLADDEDDWDHRVVAQIRQRLPRLADLFDVR